MTLRELSLLAERHEANLERQDFRSALICSVLANIYRDAKKRPEPFTPQDFMLTAPSELREAEDKEELDYLLELAKTLGGQVIVHGRSG